MDTVKKLLVLISAVLVIGLVALLLNLSQKILDPSSAEAIPEMPVMEEDNQPSSYIFSEPETRTDSLADAPVPPTEDIVSTPGHDSIQWQAHYEANSRPLGDMIPPGTNLNGHFTAAASRILPSVVFIRSARRMNQSFHGFNWQNEDDEDDEPGGAIPGSGSGIVISPNGYIMTNYHVIERAGQIRVTLYDQRTYSAKIIGGDPTTDVALLKIERKNLPAAYIGDSDSVEIGEWVMAVGNPLNFNSTVTTGIVSAMGRDIRVINEDYRIENFIQTDAVINPGNSGGALVNLSGEVIGMNTAIATGNGYYQGYGFAIPINLVKKVVNDLLKFGRVRRPLLGVSIDTVNDRVARALGLTKPAGALIQGVHEDFPAQAAGLLQGDVILAVDGLEVSSVNDLQTKIAQHHPQDTVHLTIWRDRQRNSVSLVLAEAPASSSPVYEQEDDEKISFQNLGMGLEELNPSLRSRFNMEQGLYIDKVLLGSPAAEANVFPRTVLVTVNGQEMASVEAFEDLLANTSSGDVLMLKVFEPQNRPGGNSRLLFVEVP